MKLFESKIKVDGDSTRRRTDAGWHVQDANLVLIRLVYITSCCQPLFSFSLFARQSTFFSTLLLFVSQTHLFNLLFTQIVQYPATLCTFHVAARIDRWTDSTRRDAWFLRCCMTPAANTACWIGCALYSSTGRSVCGEAIDWITEQSYGNSI